MRLFGFLETTKTSRLFPSYIVFVKGFLQKREENNWKLKIKW